MSKIEEFFLPVPNYEGLYEISNFGNVKSLSRIRKGCNMGDSILKERILKLNFDSSGYRTVKLYKNSVKKTPKVHRLVASAFIPNPEGKAQINHKDGCKTNNSVDNLEWCSHLENIRHANATGLIDIRGEKSFKAKLNDKKVIFIKTALRDGTYKQQDLADMYGVSFSVINHIKMGRTWKHLSL